MRKTTFLAVLVFFGLVGATVWTMRREPNRGIAYVTLSDLSPDSADRIELTGARPTTLQKRGGDWYLGNGRLADISQVAQLLKAAEHIRSSDLLTRDRSRWAEYGVDDPNGTGIRVLGGGHELANIVAGRAMAGGMALRKDDAAYKVPGVFPNAFVHNANEWMQRGLFLGVNDQDISRLEIALRGEPPYALLRDNDNWVAAGIDGKPLADYRLDAQGSRRLVHELANLHAEVLLDADPGAATTGFDKPGDRFTMELKPKTADGKPERRTLILGATGDNKSSYARVQGKDDVALIPGYAAVQLKKGRESLRDLQITRPLELAKVTGLQIRRGRQKLSLLRQDGTWTPAGAPAASGAGVDQGLVQRRAVDVMHARAMALAAGVTPQKAGISPTEGEIRLSLEDKSTVSLVFGRRVPGNQVYVRGTADGKIYLVNGAFQDHILGMLDTLRSKPEGDPLARFDQEGIGNLPPDVRAGLSEHFAQKKREQQALQLMKGRRH